MKPRIYVDTSVIGGCFDDEFAKESLALIEMARNGEVVLLVSDLLAQELARSPDEVRGVLEQIGEPAVQKISITEETERLMKAYLKAKVVGAGHANDAHHVALATVAKADLILSWNFKHIVHWDKIKKFNAVNGRQGYAPIDIRSPKEFV